MASAALAAWCSWTAQARYAPFVRYSASWSSIGIPTSPNKSLKTLPARPQDTSMEDRILHSDLLGVGRVMEFNAAADVKVLTALSTQRPHSEGSHDIQEKWLCSKGSNYMCHSFNQQ